MVRPEAPESRVVRPSAGGALMIVVGVAVWIPFVFFFAGLALTDGSPWTVLYFLTGFLCAWVRARTLYVSREGDSVQVRDFYSTWVFPVEPNTVLRPFSHWAGTHVPFMALHTPARTLRSLHATVLPELGQRAERAPQRVAETLAVPLELRAIGTLRQLLRRW